VNPTCGTRWFAYDLFQLKPKSGTAPYIWSVASGTLPGNTVLYENGLIYNPPINATGSWKTKIRLTDSKGRFVEKDITINSSL
jgi:hypothetical protein